MPIGSNDTTIRQKPEEGMTKKLTDTLSSVVKPTVEGKLLSIGAIALAAFALLWILPNLMQVNIFSSQTSFSSLAVFVAIAMVGGIGVIGLLSHNSKSKFLSIAETIAKAILPILLTGLALWWGADTLRTLIDQGNYGTGPFWFAALALGAGAYNASDIISCVLPGRKRLS